MKNKELINEYIGGFVHGDGKFEVNLSVKKKNDIVKIFLSPVFSITQEKKNLELMKLIWNKLNNVGFHRINNKNIIKYEVRKLESLKEIIIPFFNKYQLKDEKLLEFIKFKFIVEKLNLIENGFNNRLNNKNNDLLLDLIIISMNINKISIKNNINILRNLSEIDKKRVLENKLSSEIKKELENLIINFDKNDILNKDFINGLFDSNKGWITLNLELSPNNLINLKLKYGIQSVGNIDLINYFKIGKIIENNYLISNTDNILNIILPKLYNVSSIDEILKIEDSSIIIKDLKIKKIIEIFNKLKLLTELSNENNNKIINEILLISYEIRDIKLKNKECLKDYLIRMKKKLNII